MTALIDPSDPQYLLKHLVNYMIDTPTRLLLNLEIQSS